MREGAAVTGIAPVVALAVVVGVWTGVPVGRFRRRFWMTGGGGIRRRLCRRCR